MSKPKQVIMGGTPDSNQLAFEIMKLCQEYKCNGYETIGALESVKHQLMAEAHTRMIATTERTDTILCAGDGYQPTESNLDMSNPPRGGSGVPNRRKGQISDDDNLNIDEARSAFNSWLTICTKDFTNQYNARFRVITDCNGILQAVKS